MKKFCVVFLLFVAGVQAVPLELKYGKPEATKGRHGYKLFEGDMFMPVAEVNAAVHGQDVDSVRVSRGLTNRPSRKWPGGVVPFVKHESVKSKFLNSLGLRGAVELAIDRAMNEWQEKTCVKFIPRTTEKDYIEFYRGKGCSSFVGRIGGKQGVSLGFFCWWPGVAQHELGHALGFHHEHSRPDRDDYVDIIWKNVKDPTWLRKYSRSSIDSLGVPYDYDSVMHYDKRAFAKWPWQTTIQPKKSGVSIGFKWHISELDTKQANMFYQCPAKTRVTE